MTNIITPEQLHELHRLVKLDVDGLIPGVPFLSATESANARKLQGLRSKLYVVLFLSRLRVKFPDGIVVDKNDMILGGAQW